ncbi:DUF423 domain-containing protein [Polaribacter sp.]|uniref:DUF423 domain-containing protein n=1 Tax=Polaribacter sp. TaxID=1920175 RepID=UPI0040477A26
MFKNLIITCFFGVTAIVLGAFGSHALKEILTFDQLQSFETAVRYQIYHAIVLLFVATFDGISAKQKQLVNALFYLGILFFSGSIYVIQLTSIQAKSIWFITPLGGLFLIAGWITMIVLFIKKVNVKL